MQEGERDRRPDWKHEEPMPASRLETREVCDGGIPFGRCGGGGGD